MGKTSDSNTIDMPITRLGNNEDDAEIKETPDVNDYIPIIEEIWVGNTISLPLRSTKYNLLSLCQQLCAENHILKISKEAEFLVF